MSSKSQEGHRKRLRNKFLRSGTAGFHDYEIVELLLTLGTPRKDCKQQAKEAMRKFKTLRGVLEAPLEELQEIKGIGPHNVFGIKLIQEIARKFLKDKILERPICKSAREVFEYLYHSMRDLKKEVFKVIFLDSRNQIIEISTLFEGTLNASSIYPREVIKTALKFNSVSLIFVHNHPSGDPFPSVHDKTVTENLVFASRAMELNVWDHIVIGDNRYFSFAEEGLIEGYIRNFSAMKKAARRKD
jgi:DNA repair protein RadC